MCIYYQEAWNEIMLERFEAICSESTDSIKKIKVSTLTVLALFIYMIADSL